MKLETDTVEKFTRNKSCSFVKMNKVNWILQGKIEKVQVTNIGNEEGDIITDSIDVKKIVIGHYGLIYAHKF